MLPNGPQRGPKGRKRLVQPVLPALPILKKPSQLREQLNDRQGSTADGTILDASRANTPAFSESIPETTALVELKSAQTEKPSAADKYPTLAEAMSLHDGIFVEDRFKQAHDLVPGSNTHDTGRQGTRELDTRIVSTPTLISEGTDTPASEAVSDPNRDENISHMGMRTPPSLSRGALSYEHESISSLPHPNGTVSPLSSREQQAVELSTQPTPSVSAAEPASPPSSYLHLNERKLHDSQQQTVPEMFTNGHEPPSLRPQPNLSGVVHSLPPSVPMPTVQEHLLYLSASKQFSDWMIQVDYPFLNHQSTVFYTHGLVLLRSERLRKFIIRPREVNHPSQVITLYPPRVIQPHAFEAALRFLYSDTVLGTVPFLKDSFMDTQAKSHVVDYTLSYLIAGIELGIEPVSMRALDMLASVADWDVAELLVKEAVGLRQIYSLTRERDAPPEPYAIANSILRFVFGLFTSKFDAQTFQLDVNSSPSLLIPRLASFENGRPSSNPALAGMVFGSMPSSAHRSPSSPAEGLYSSANAVASLILLNLDHVDLAVLCQDMVRVHGGAGVRVISDVVEERERRRALVVGSQSVPNKRRMANPALWETVAWREFMDDAKVCRERVGFLQPNKQELNP